MRILQTEQMQSLNGGCEWSWKPRLQDIAISGGNNCQDIYDYYGGDACYAATQIGVFISICLNSSGGGGD